MVNEVRESGDAFVVACLKVNKLRHERLYLYITSSMTTFAFQTMSFHLYPKVSKIWNEMAERLAVGDTIIESFKVMSRCNTKGMPENIDSW